MSVITRQIDKLNDKINHITELLASQTASKLTDKQKSQLDLTKKELISIRDYKLSSI